jgi:hypothetical protein
MPGNDKGGVSLDSVRNQIMSYEQQIKQYLDNLEAKVETYKFSVETTADGLTIDMALKATIHSKKKSK